MEPRCDICDSPDYVGVAAVPGFAVSLAWCTHCLKRAAFPMFCIDVTLCDEDASGDILTISETIEKHGLDMVLSIGAEWFMESILYVPANANQDVEPHWRYEGPGHYMTVEDYVRKCAKV